MFTSNSRSAVAEICGFIQLNYEHQFEDTLPIQHEILKHQLTRDCYPVRQGWYSSNNAEPKKLLAKGYDKVVFVQREMISLFKSLAEYHRGCFTMEDLINLSLVEPNFFLKQKKWYDLLNVPIEDHRYLKITLEDWNNWTLNIYNKLLDFLEFPKKNRMALAPVHVDRNFEAYSDSHITKETIIDQPIEVIRNRS